MRRQRLVETPKLKLAHQTSHPLHERRPAQALREPEPARNLAAIIIQLARVEFVGMAIDDHRLRTARRKTSFGNSRKYPPPATGARQPRQLHTATGTSQISPPLASRTSRGPVSQSAMP